MLQFLWSGLLLWSDSPSGDVTRSLHCFVHYGGTTQCLSGHRTREKCALLHLDRRESAAPPITWGSFLFISVDAACTRCILPKSDNEEAVCVFGSFILFYAWRNANVKWRALVELIKALYLKAINVCGREEAEGKGTLNYPTDFKTWPVFCAFPRYLSESAANQFGAFYAPYFSRASERQKVDRFLPELPWQVFYEVGKVQILSVLLAVQDLYWQPFSPIYLSPQCVFFSKSVTSVYQRKSNLQPSLHKRKSSVR